MENVFNPLVPDLSAKYALQKTGDLNGCPLLCMLWDDDLI
jgi:hypothetical protein